MSTFHRAEEIFTAALDRPEAERDAFVEERCAGDQRLCEQVLALLAARRQMGGFLDVALTDARGQTFGAWRVEEEIGRGGMSIVYRGSRSDGGFDKQVAIKVIFVDSGRAAETRMLAALEHPNIARLLDGGLTPLGFPYLVMELVAGVPLTRYAHELDEERKLRLFLQVCEGVQAAHAALIVHRDLKPDNILVNDAGLVKLLDFGIAKLLEPGEAQTAGLRAYTPDYASPEQIEGRPASTANDVFSLGVLLRELITGSPKRVEPTAPMPADLTMIVDKATRSDPAERYASAGDLARDVDLYLRQLPIEARPPSWTYQARKFVRRHRYAVAASAAAIAALALVTGFAIRQARLAEQRAEQVHGLARKLLFDLEGAITTLPGSIPARQLIVKESVTYLDALSQDENASDAIQLDAARGYQRLAEIFGRDRGHENLGEPGEALRCLRKAEVLARRVAQRTPRGDAPGLLSVLLESRSSAHGLLGQWREAVEAAEAAVASSEAEVRQTPGSAAARERLAQALVRLSDSRVSARQTDQVAAPLERAIALFEELERQDRNNGRYRSRLARAHQYMTLHTFRAKDYARSAKHSDASLALSRALAAEDPRRYRAQLATDLGHRASLLREQGRFADSLQTFDQQLAIRRAMEADHPQDVSTAVRVAATLDRICITQLRAGDPAAALQACLAARDKLVALERPGKVNTQTSGEHLLTLVDLAHVYQAMGNRRGACTAYQDAERVASRPVGDALALGYQKEAREKAAECRAAK